MKPEPITPIAAADWHTLPSETISVRLACDAQRGLEPAEAEAMDGLRVLAFARGARPHGTAEPGHADVADGLAFLRLQGMVDPPRPEAIAAGRACQDAGIRVKLITGDHALTATPMMTLPAVERK